MTAFFGSVFRPNVIGGAFGLHYVALRRNTTIDALPNPPHHASLTLLDNPLRMDHFNGHSHVFTGIETEYNRLRNLPVTPVPIQDQLL